MGQPALLNVYQLRIYCYDVPPTQLSVNTLYFRVTDVTGVGTMSEQSMTEALDALWATRYKPCLSNGSEYYGLSAQRYNIPLPRPVMMTSHLNTGAGTAGGNTLPNQVTGLISLKTALAGKNYRGRIYTPFLPAIAADANGLMTAAFAAILVANIAQFIPAVEIVTSGGNTISGGYSLKSRIQISLPPLPKTNVWTPIDRASVPQRFATQRRRGQYGRINALPF
jgi:hypothetical protein